MDKNKFIDKIPSYIHGYEGFNKFLRLINDYVLSAHGEVIKFVNNLYDYTSNIKTLENIDVFVLESIVNVLGIKIPEVNKQDKNYKNYLDLSIKSVIINRTFHGSRQSLKDVLENIFLGSKINVVDGGLNNNVGGMHLNVSVDNISLNDIPYNIFRNYITPKILGVTSNFTYKQGNVFTYDLDFNEAVEVYNEYKDNQIGFESWLEGKPEVKFVLQKQKSSNATNGEWKEAWKGNLLIWPEPSWEIGTIDINYGLYDSITIDLTNKILQVDGYWQKVRVVDEYNTEVINTQHFYASKDNSVKESNLPFQSSASAISAQLLTPIVNNLRIQQPAKVCKINYKGVTVVEYFVVTALYYYDEGVGSVFPEDYVKACREIKNETGKADEINMWINPEAEEYAGGIIVTKTLYGFSNNEQLEEYKPESPINNSIYIVEV